MSSLDRPLIHVVLYEPEIPPNTGAVGRTCVAVGAKLWLVRPLGFRVDDYYLRRAGMDYWEHLDWEVVDHWPALRQRLPARPWLFTKHGELSYTEAPIAPGDVLVFGRESSGLPRALLDEFPDRRVRIPIRPAARSLNLSNAVAVAAFEVRRRFPDFGPDAPPEIAPRP